ncbi:hypothetical protein [Microbacterium sp.]|uniref:hypothetical protein n=1 Tax=Microbacterium sp. TaxID=51671 RepID=UPI00333FA171
MRIMIAGFPHETDTFSDAFERLSRPHGDGGDRRGDPGPIRADPAELPWRHLPAGIHRTPRPSGASS